MAHSTFYHWMPQVSRNKTLSEFQLEPNWCRSQCPHSRTLWIHHVDQINDSHEIIDVDQLDSYSSISMPLPVPGPPIEIDWAASFNQWTKILISFRLARKLDHPCIRAGKVMIQYQQWHKSRWQQGWLKVKLDIILQYHITISYQPVVFLILWTDEYGKRWHFVCARGNGTSRPFQSAFGKTVVIPTVLEIWSSSL